MVEQVIIQATDAINLDNISAGGTAKELILPVGTHTVSFTGDLNFNGANLLLQQIFVFGTAPLTTGNPQGWYFVVDQGQEVLIESDGINPTYVFLVDQVDIADNTGAATVVFTPINDGQ